MKNIEISDESENSSETQIVTEKSLEDIVLEELTNENFDFPRWTRYLKQQDIISYRKTFNCIARVFHYNGFIF